MFKASFITLFPEAFPGPLGVSILERARREGIWDYETVQLRDFGLGKHQNGLGNQTNVDALNQ